MIDIIVDTIIDVLKLIPFLFVAFLLIEVLEHKLTNKNNPIINTIIFNLLYTNKSSKKIILLDILMFFETIFIVIILLIIYQYFYLYPISFHSTIIFLTFLYKYR